MDLPVSHLRCASAGRRGWVAQRGWACWLALYCSGIFGCQGFHPAALWPPLAGAPPAAGPVPGTRQPPGVAIPNPLRITGAESEFVWNQLVDTVDDYFQIESERRVQVIGGVLTEGRIETYYRPGATALEPWHWDSASDYELALATLQSIRRRASVRVVPQAGGFDVYVEVVKELEDVDRPAQATPGTSIPRPEISMFNATPLTRDMQVTLGWIPLGRDVALEQEILRELSGRVYEPPRR